MTATKTEWVPGDPLFSEDSTWNRNIFDIVDDDGAWDHVGCPRCNYSRFFWPEYQAVSAEEEQEILRTCPRDLGGCGTEHGIFCPFDTGW